MSETPRKAGRVAAAASGVLAVAAVVRELRRPRRRRRWHGRILGVPYDFRLPTARRVKRAWWSPRDPRVLMPRAFGVGWDVNVGRLWHVLARRGR